LADHLQKLSRVEILPRTLLPQLDRNLAEFAASFVRTIEWAANTFPAN